MRILLVTHRIPFPPDKGDKIRSFHLLSQLARHHEVDLLTHVDEISDLRHVQVLRDICRRVEVFPLNPWVGKLRAGIALLSGAPLSVAYMTRPQARARFEELLREGRPDVIVGYSTQVAAYLPAGPLPPVVFDLVDVDSEKHQSYADESGGVSRFINALEARRLRRFERKVAERASRLVLTTPREAALFRERVSKRPVSVITNGVKLPPRVSPRERVEDPLLLFVGQMDYEPNIRAAEIAATEVLPRVRKGIPGARLRICGRRPSARVELLADREGVEVTGEVPDTTPHFLEARVALLPLPVVRGIQNKVLESMSFGLPVVATPEVLRCLGEGAAAGVSTGESGDELASATLNYLHDDLLRVSAGEAGRSYVETEHDWEHVGEVWRELLDELTTSRDGAPARVGG